MSTRLTLVIGISLLAGACTGGSTRVDDSPPTLGTPIELTSTSSTSMQATWGPASDGHTLQQDLEYKVVMTTLGPWVIDTIVEAQSTVGAGLVRDWTRGLTTVDIHGLSPNVTYYVAVLVRDEAGNHALYAPAEATTAPDPSAEKMFTEFSFESLEPSALGTIDEVNKTISVEVPLETNVSDLVATFTVNTNATVRIESTVQQSGVTSNDFSSPVVYTVVAQNGTTQDYTVTVTVRQPSSEKQLLTFAFPSAAPAGVGLVAEADHSVRAFVPDGTDRTELVAAFTTSPGAVVHVADVVQESGVTANDFAGALEYTVVAEDGSSQAYTVTVQSGPSDIAALEGLVLSHGALTPGFHHATLAYTATVAVSSLTVTATAHEPSATLTIHGASTASGTESAAIELDLGDNLIDVVVLAPDGVTERTYTLDVTRYPSITVAATVTGAAQEDADWASAMTYDDPGDDSLQGDSTPPDLSRLRLTNDGTHLYIAAYLEAGANKHWDDNGLYVLIDADGAQGETTGATTFTANPPFPWGDKHFTTAMGVDLAVLGYANESGFEAFGFSDDDTSGTSVAGQVAVDFNTEADEAFYFVARIPLSLLAVERGDTIRVIALLNGWNGTNGDRVADVLPDSPLVAAEVNHLANYVTYEIM